MAHTAGLTEAMTRGDDVATTYKMTRSAGVCAATGRLFEQGDEQITALFDDPSSPDALVRLDYHPSHWDPRAAIAAKGALIAFWRHEARPSATDDDAMTPGDLISMFEQLPDDQEEAAGLRYVIALMLVRKRELVVADVAPDRAKAIVVHRKGSPDDLIEVAEPELSAEKLERLGARLAELLDV